MLKIRHIYHLVLFIPLSSLAHSQTPPKTQLSSTDVCAQYTKAIDGLEKTDPLFIALSQKCTAATKPDSTPAKHQGMNHDNHSTSHSH
jgi:hypothetical protein